MTPEEKDALNRRVAQAMGYSVIKRDDAYQVLLNGSAKSLVTYRHEGYAWESLGDFCADPAACATLKAHMRAQGWHYDIRWGTDGALAYADTRAPHYCIGDAYKQDTEEIALALAFLAAHDAEQEDKK